MRLNFYYLYPENFFYAPQEPVYQPLGLGFGLLPGQQKKKSPALLFSLKMIGSWTWTCTQKIFSHIFHSHIRATARRWAVTTAAFWVTPPFPFVPLPAAGRSQRSGYTIEVGFL